MNDKALISARDNLDARKRKLLLAVAEGKPLPLALNEAGYRTKPAWIDEFFNDPRVVAEVTKHLNSLIQVNDRPRIRAIMLEMLEGTEFAPKIRIEAGKVLLSMLNPDDRADTLKAPGEMTADELRQAMDRLNGELFNRSEAAVIIENEAVPDIYK